MLYRHSMENELVNLWGLARRLNLPRDWLQRKAEAGEIPCLSIGRKRRFNVRAVEAVIAEMAAKSRQEGNRDDA